MTNLEIPERNKPKRTANLPLATFLARPDIGRTIAKYRKNQIVFSQGDPADAVFYVQKGKLKITVVSDRGKEGSPRCLARTNSSVKPAWRARYCAW